MTDSRGDGGLLGVSALNDRRKKTNTGNIDHHNCPADPKFSFSWCHVDGIAVRIPHRLGKSAAIIHAFPLYAAPTVHSLTTCCSLYDIHNLLHAVSARINAPSGDC